MNKLRESLLFLGIFIGSPFFSFGQDLFEKTTQQVNSYMSNIATIGNIVCYVIIAVSFIVAAVKLKSDQGSKVKIIGSTILVILCCALALYFLQELANTASGG